MVLGKINRCDIYVCIWALYHLQGILYPQGRINQILQFIMLFWALIVGLRYLLPAKGMPKTLNAACLLVYMFAFYGLFYIIFEQNVNYLGLNELPSYFYLQQSVRSLLPIFLFYHYSKTGYLTEHRIRYYILIMIAVYIASFYFDYYNFVSNDDLGRTEWTNNNSYYFLLLMPMAYLYYKKPLLQYLLLAVLLLYVLMGMKRGAILIGVVCFLYLIYQMLQTSKNFKQRSLILILSIAVIGFIVYRVYVLLHTSNYFIYRINRTLAGDSSGRDIVWTVLWTDFWQNSSVVNLLFGHGANSTGFVAGTAAHNDWLETLYCNGIVGVLILLNFYYSVFKDALKINPKTSPHLRSAFFLLLAIIFARTLFSMSIQDMDVPLTMIIGYLLYVSKYHVEEDVSYDK